MHRLPELLSALLRSVFKLALFAFFAALVASILLIGLCAALLTLLWALLRGRKPAAWQTFMRFQRSSRQFRSGRWPGAQTAEARQDADVVDVQAHEVRGALDERR